MGMVSGRSVRLDTIIWPGGDLSVAAVSTRARTVFRVVTALAPPFVMESELDEDGQCLRGKNVVAINFHQTIILKCRKGDFEYSFSALMELLFLPKSNNRQCSKIQLVTLITF